MKETKNPKGEAKEKPQTNFIHNAQDGLFKRYMSVRENAIDFFSLHLDKAIWARTDVNSMKLCPNSFVDNELKHRHVDVLYQTKFDKKPGYLYLLTEQVRHEVAQMKPINFYG